jgi:hypothetical protein
VLQHYQLELHNLTPMGILHIMTYVALCEGYMGIDPHFQLWNYFFHDQRSQDPNAELIVLGGGAWLSTSGPGKVSLLTSTSPCPNRFKGG